MRPFVEFQLHSGLLKGGVRCLFLTRRQAALWGAGILAFGLFLTFGLTVSPEVGRRLLQRGEYRRLLAERARHGERLRELLGRLGELETQADELRLQTGRIHLAYGLEGIPARGQGGFPFDPPPAAGGLEGIHAAGIRQGNLVVSRTAEGLRVVEALLAEIRSYERSHEAQVRTTPSICPLRAEDFVLTSPFGTRRNPFTKGLDFHAGLDLAAPVGAPIHAPADGVVVFAGRFPLRRSVSWWRYGNLVAIRHGQSFISLFGHCDRVQVRRGQRVEQGQLLANVGNTGWSTSPHLHYEVRRRAEGGDYLPVDPRIYILDHRWRDEERLLVSARQAPAAETYEPLPRLLGR